MRVNKSITLCVGLMLFSISAFCFNHQNGYVRFEHVGIQDKPFYNLTVGSHKATPIPKTNSNFFDQILVTTEANYADLCKGILQCQYLAMTKNSAANERPFYKVTVNGKSFMLNKGNAFMFFRKLTILMRKKPVYADIAKKLDYINTQIGR